MIWVNQFHSYNTYAYCTWLRQCTVQHTDCLLQCDSTALKDRTLKIGNTFLAQGYLLLRVRNCKSVQITG